MSRVALDGYPLGDVKEDRITELICLNSTDFLIVQRVFDLEDTGFREERQQRILFFRDNPNNSILLNSGCWDFGGLYYNDPFLAFHCAHEVAGDYLIHRCEVYCLEPPGGKIFEKLYCRNPVLLENKRLRCEEEDVNSEGKLSLTAIEQPLPISIGEVLPVVKLPPMSLNGSMDCQGRIDATQRCQAVGLCVHFTNYVELISDRNPLLLAAMDQNGLYST